MNAVLCKSMLSVTDAIVKMCYSQSSVIEISDIQQVMWSQHGSLHEAKLN